MESPELYKIKHSEGVHGGRWSVGLPPSKICLVGGLLVPQLAAEWALLFANGH